MKLVCHGFLRFLNHEIGRHGSETIKWVSGLEKGFTGLESLVVRRWTF